MIIGVMSPKWILSHARGYLELGLVERAREELSGLPAAWQEKTEVLGLRAVILQELQEWLLLQPLAGDLAGREPENPGWWVIWAYATRRAESIQAAEAILREAELRHPGEATIQFNLGCYACQQGRLPEAKSRVEKAIELERAFADSARTDPDLEPLRRQGLL